MLDRKTIRGLLILAFLLVAVPSFVIADDETFTVVIEDEDVGAWMAINNAFTRVGNEDWDVARTYWTGVLIQLGDFESIAIPRLLMEVFHSVVFRDGETEVLTLTRQDFLDHLLWVTVVTRDEDDDRDDPMAATDLDRLKLDPPSRLHRYLHPVWGGITIWQGREVGYTMTATTKDDEEEPHVSWAFELVSTDDFDVEIYKDGVADDTDLSAVDNIIVRAHGEVGHGGHHNPPQE